MTLRLNVLRIAVVPWGSAPLLGDVPCEWRLRDFLIDGRPLAEYLGVSRLGLDLCGSPLSGAGYSRYRAFHADYARQLTGATPADNQFCSGRVVLYGCHCGCDYCGVISARVERSGAVVRWLDIGFEDERGARGTTAFAFRTRQAAAAVAGFLRRSRRAVMRRDKSGRESIG
jgi:hypothetical protein